MSERTYNYNYILAEKERAQTQQAERVSNKGLDGVSDLWLKSGKRIKVRFLLPYPLGIEMMTHGVTGSDGKPTTYLCERQFSADPAVYCPICQDVNDSANEDFKKGTRMKRVRNFLCYVYDWENERDNQGAPRNRIGILKLGPGDRHGKNFKALEMIHQSFGLTEVDVVIDKQGTGLETTIDFLSQPETIMIDGRKTMSGTPFDLKTKVDPKVLQNFPKLPGHIDQLENNEESITLINDWGNFYLKAGRFRTVDTYTKPQTFYANTSAPYSGTAPGFQPAPVGTYPVQPTPAQQPGSFNNPHPYPEQPTNYQPAYQPTPPAASMPTQHPGMPSPEIPWD